MPHAGLTIQNGAAGAGGGAILISGHAQPYISDCTFLNNVVGIASCVSSMRTAAELSISSPPASCCRHRRAAWAAGLFSSKTTMGFRTLSPAHSRTIQLPAAGLWRWMTVPPTRTPSMPQSKQGSPSVSATFPATGRHRLAPGAGERCMVWSLLSVKTLCCFFASRSAC